MGNAKAMNFVGSFHEDGWVVLRDMAKAARHYARAAEGGDFRGCFNHARMLGEKGRAEEALTWIERAGSTAMTWMSRRCSLRKRPTPLIVPPVPEP